MEVWHEHNVIAAYPPGTAHEVDAEGALLVGGDRHLHGEWSAVGTGLVCAFVTPDPYCPNCNPKENEQ